MGAYGDFAKELPPAISSQQHYSKIIFSYSTLSKRHFQFSQPLRTRFHLFPPLFSSLSCYGTQNFLFYFLLLCPPCYYY